MQKDWITKSMDYSVRERAQVTVLKVPWRLKYTSQLNLLHKQPCVPALCLPLGTAFLLLAFSGTSSTKLPWCKTHLNFSKTFSNPFLRPFPCYTVCQIYKYMQTFSPWCFSSCCTLHHASVLQLKTTSLKVVPIFSAPGNFNLILLFKASAESCVEQCRFLTTQLKAETLFFCESTGNLIAQK